MSAKSGTAVRPPADFTGRDGQCRVCGQPHALRANARDGSSAPKPDLYAATRERASSNFAGDSAPGGETSRAARTSPQGVPKSNPPRQPRAEPDPVLTAATSARRVRLRNFIVIIGPKTMTRNLCGRLLAICAVCVAVVTVSPSLSAHDSGTADALMLRLMSTHNGPGAALALIKNGSIVLDKGYGFRDLAAHAPVTTATLFNIGSISKSFTALGVTQLVDQHQLDLDAPVLRYIPDLRLSDPQATQAVTLRQLLSHTSGLPADEQWPQQVPATRDGIVSEFANMPITAQPGTRFQYCSRCIVLAAYVLERITGQSWEAYTRTHIFAPLGIDDGLIRASRAGASARPSPTVSP